MSTNKNFNMLLAGFGGQGILFAGKVIAYGGLMDEKEISWLTLEKLSMWDDIADKDIAEQTFTDSLNHMFDSLLELRQEELIARDRTHGLSSEERRELWTISQELAKK